MRHSAFILFVLFVITVGLAGCGSGETVPIPLRSPSGLQEAKKEGLRVAVLPFEDKRSEKARLGERTHLGGGKTYFAIANGNAGEAMARVVADYLSSKGWQAGTAASREAASGADLLMAGEIQDLSANAKSRVFSTEIIVKLQIALHTANALDGSTANLSLAGSRTRTVFWFNPEDVQEEVNLTVMEGLDRLLSDAKANRLLPFK